MSAPLLQSEATALSCGPGCVGGIRPPLDEKLFPVDRPSGFKRADWNSFFFDFFFFPKKYVHSSQ